MWPAWGVVAVLFGTGPCGPFGQFVQDCPSRGHALRELAAEFIERIYCLSQALRAFFLGIVGVCAFSMERTSAMAHLNAGASIGSRGHSALAADLSGVFLFEAQAGWVPFKLQACF